MRESVGGRYDPAILRGVAKAEQDRAERAAGVARRHEFLAETAAESMRPFHARMAKLHRDAERKHHVAAALHADYADTVGIWADRKKTPPDHPPAFMAAMAEASGIPSLAVTFFSSQYREAVVLVSDSMAARAHDLEYLFGEGPSRIALGRSVTLSVCGEDDLSRYWPSFGPSASEIGVQSVVSARLGAAGPLTGALTAYRLSPDADPVTTNWVTVMADALTTTALNPGTRLDVDDGLPVHPLFGDVDIRLVVHQATGMVMTSHECTASDALALILARAYTLQESVTEVARTIVNRTSTLS